MRNRFLGSGRRDLLTGILLALLLFRAYVPIGFMPASGAPFLVELCPAAGGLQIPMPMLGHHHQHSDFHSHFENCPFGSATTAGPLPIFGGVGPLPQVDFQIADTIDLAPIEIARPHLPQPRGPPSLV